MEVYAVYGGFIFSDTMFDYNNPALVDSKIGNMKGTGVENCHAAGMGLMRQDAIGEGRGIQPGEFVSGHASDSTKLDANAKYNPTNNYENLVNATIGDYAGAAHKTLKPYEEGMTGGYLVVLVVSEGENGSPQDYHYYKQALDGTFEHKPGSSRYVIGVKDPVVDAKERGYGKTVVYLYATDNKE